MAFTCISSSLFTPLQLHHHPPHFSAATFHPFPSIQLTPSHPFRLSALPLFTGNNNGGQWRSHLHVGGNNPFGSDDDSSSSSSGYTLFLTLQFSSITFCFCNLFLTKFAI
ncbi:hypothetical protein TSUD_140750 [Trifolium subterraneum]|uniref:Uncharacterized protein n=1 Tax=Trifolium subterraneum TaxID=3900 RepID=A0A2Z6NA07_TRISU|nr:hypothetical protein TSUD_140750 [Trifolium subterraneum]